MKNTQVHGVDEAIANLKIWEWGDDYKFDAIIDDITAKIKEAIPDGGGLYRHGAQVAIEQVARDLQAGYLYAEYSQGVGLLADLHLLESDIVATFDLGKSIEMLISELSNDMTHDKPMIEDAVSLAADFRKWARILEDAVTRESTK